MGNVTKRFDVVVGRKYESKGETKTHWINIGEGAEWDDGGISLKLHTVPVGAWWDGTAKLFDRDRDKKDSDKPAPRQAARDAAAPSSADNMDDDIPF